MSEQCTCRHPTVAGEGEQQHCTRCGAWTALAIQAYYDRTKREQQPLPSGDAPR